jgi:hypothetical protein
MPDPNHALFAARGAAITSATAVAAAGDVPAHCRVQGSIPQAIHFELRMPVADWNGKFYLAGCGGFCGSLDADRSGVVNALNHGLRRSRILQAVSRAAAWA